MPHLTSIELYYPLHIGQMRLSVKSQIKQEIKKEKNTTFKGR